MRVVVIPCLSDNYAYLVISSSGDAAVVDASEAAPIRQAIKKEGVSLRAIWSTHHHWDHVGGNEELASTGNIEVTGHVSDRGRLPALTRAVDSGDKVSVGDVEATCLHVPGHTRGAVAYFIETRARAESPSRESARAVFTGDTMFCAGCGRLFEGTPQEMHDSLSRLASLPPDTAVYCGHEYTLSNLKFAASVEPSNEAVQVAISRAKALRARGGPTIGTPMGDELCVNPFLRLGSPEIRSSLGIPADAGDVSAFAAIRRAKDAFR